MFLFNAHVYTCAPTRRSIPLMAKAQDARTRGRASLLKLARALDQTCHARCKSALPICTACLRACLPLYATLRANRSLLFSSRKYAVCHKLVNASASERARIGRVGNARIPHPEASFALLLDKRLRIVLVFECRQKRQIDSSIRRV